MSQEIGKYVDKCICFFDIEYLLCTRHNSKQIRIKGKKQNISFWSLHSSDERQKVNNKHGKYITYTFCIK